MVAGKRRVIATIWNTPRITVIISGPQAGEYDDDLGGALIYEGSHNLVLVSNFSLSSPAKFYNTYPKSNLGPHSKLMAAVKDGTETYLLMLNTISRSGVAVNVYSGEELARWNFPDQNHVDTLFQNELGRLDISWLVTEHAYLSWTIDPKGKHSGPKDPEGDWGNIVQVSFPMHTLKDSLERRLWKEEPVVQTCLKKGHGTDGAKDKLAPDSNCKTKPHWEPSAGYVDNWMIVLVDRRDGSVYHFGVNKLLNHEFDQPNVFRYSGASFWLDAQGNRVVFGPDVDPYDDGGDDDGRKKWIYLLLVFLFIVVFVLLGCCTYWWCIGRPRQMEAERKLREDAEAERQFKEQQNLRQKQLRQLKAKMMARKTYSLRVLGATEVLWGR